MWVFIALIPATILALMFYVGCSLKLAKGLDDEPCFNPDQNRENEQ